MSELGFLADTHVLIWWIEDDPRLSAAHIKVFESPAPVIVSAISLFEIAVKRSIGKLETRFDPISAITDGKFRQLPITWKHARAVEALPFHHRDPFDRLLIAQTISEGLTLLTADADIRRYDVPVL